MRNLSGTTTQDVKKKWSFQTGDRSREVQFAWNPMVDGDFQKLENGLSKGVVPNFQTDFTVIQLFESMFMYLALRIMCLLGSAFLRPTPRVVSSDSYKYGRSSH